MFFRDNFGAGKVGKPPDVRIEVEQIRDVILAEVMKREVVEGEKFANAEKALTPQAGLKELEALYADPQLTHSHRLDAARAHLLERAGQIEEAINLDHAAAARASNLPERNYVILRAAKFRSHTN